MKNYLLICEIGPIWDFTRQSRKTIDFWGASFLFSYVMYQVAKQIKDNGGDIFLPHLEKNPIWSGEGDITCGSIPDQIYALIEETKKVEIEKALKFVIEDTIKIITGEIILHLKQKNMTINCGEINAFFNFFYIFHEIKDTKKLSYAEFIEAEHKIKMRYAFRPFKQSAINEEGIEKWQKCNLCGDRKKAHEITVDTDAELYNEERICSVCLLKRFLHKTIPSLLRKCPELKYVEPKYKSTSDIAAIPINDRLDLYDKKDGYDEFKTALTESRNKLQLEYQKRIEDEWNKKSERNSSQAYDIDKGRSFFDASQGLSEFSNCFRNAFINFENEIIKNDTKYIPLKWFTRPFYCIVYMDGDNMGEILKTNKDNFSPYIKKVSQILSVFSNSVYDIVTKHHGQLIFAGGEDVNFIIHPEYLLDCIKELNEYYNNLFFDEPLTYAMAEKFTLSAGAVICYHKYPLSRTILNAGMMLKDYAKKHAGKNATAISLIKGHTETFKLTLPNKLIDDLRALKDCLLQSSISRTTPYRIMKSGDLLDSITDYKSRRNYLRTIIAGTRGTGKETENIDEIVNLLMEFGDTNTMINALLYARFLAGDK